jgi:N-acetylglucosamine-6-sulfatase
MRRLRRMGGLPRAFCGTLLALAVLTTASPAAAGEDQPAERPNVIVVVTDDQPISSYRPEYMPRTFRLFVDRSTDFTQSVVATPLCCPSRAALATGQYGHNNGVLRNDYNRLKRKRNVLPGWLRRSGYLTMHVGRFFNGWGIGPRRAEVAPGFEIWRTAVQPRRYYDYTMRFNNRFRKYGSEDRDYLTTNINRIAAKLVRRKAPRRRPFYLQIDQFAPHDGRDSKVARCEDSVAPGPADGQAFENEPLYPAPSYDEVDISDKPSFFESGAAPLNPTSEDLIQRTWGCQLASLQEVDRGMGDLYRELRLAKSLRDTVVIFTSDNGYIFGEHRIVLDKHYPYEESVRVPLAIRLPKPMAPEGQPSASDAPVANIDLAPTILELAGAEPCKAGGCRTLDGRSLLAEARGEAATIPPDRGIAIEYDSGKDPAKGLVCAYQAVRTTSALFVEHSRGRGSLQQSCEQPATAFEHYRLDTDPFQLENLYPAPGGRSAAEQSRLLARTRSLATCSGIAGRDPEPLSGDYCE